MTDLAKAVARLDAGMSEALGAIARLQAVNEDLLAALESIVEVFKLFQTPEFHFDAQAIAHAEINRP